MSDFDPAPYESALAAAKADLDRLQPLLQQLADQQLALRLIVRGASLLLDVEIEDQYQFPALRADGNRGWSGGRSRPPTRLSKAQIDGAG